MSFLRAHSILVLSLFVCLFFLLNLRLAQTDSATYDERAHIPAGYAQVRYGDIRINPEHPPLLKDLAGLPLLFMNLGFPLSAPEWQTGTNEQWSIGSMFLNCSRPELLCNPDRPMLFWSRFLLILVACGLAFLLFFWGRKTGGALTGLLATFLFVTDPNIIAHSHLVTTDIGIAAFLFLSFFFFIRFLKHPSWTNTFWAGLFFTLVQLVKFSAVLLFPIYGLFTLLSLLALTCPPDQTKWQWLGYNFKLYFSRLIAIFVFYSVFVYIFYAVHTLNTPPDHIDAIANMMFPDKGLGPFARHTVEAISHLPFLKPVAAYLLGVFMVFGRVAGGNTHYFLGTVQGDAQKLYFPFVFFFKETLPFLLLLVCTFFYSLKKIILKLIHEKKNHRACAHLFNELLTVKLETTLLVFFVIFYSFISIFGNLNIGIRHLFPIFPILIYLVAKTTVSFFQDTTISLSLRRFFGFLLTVLLFWQALTVLFVYPRYLSYYNELAGGNKDGWKIATDSNYDWGQDLFRLKTFINTHNQCLTEPASQKDCSQALTSLPRIDTLHVDYFGGSDPKNTLGETFDGWWSERTPQSGWYALSLNTLTEKWTLSQQGDTRASGYDWLRAYTPVTTVGDSLWIYYIP